MANERYATTLPVLLLSHWLVETGYTSIMPYAMIVVGYRLRALKLMVYLSYHHFIRRSMFHQPLPRRLPVRLPVSCSVGAVGKNITGSLVGQC